MTDHHGSLTGPAGADDDPPRGRFRLPGDATRQPRGAMSTVGTSDLFETPAPDAGTDVFAQRVAAATLGALDTFAIHLGRTLGWYQALVDDGPLPSVELARRTGTHERYAREWLEQQAAGGWLLADGPADLV